MWTLSSPPYLIHAILPDQIEAGRLDVGAASGFPRSDDIGAHRSLHAAGLPSRDPQIWALPSLQHGHTLVAATDDPHVFLSRDNGDHWVGSRQALGAGGMFSLLGDPPDPTPSWAAPPAANGARWTPVSTGPSSTAPPPA